MMWRGLQLSMMFLGVIVALICYHCDAFTSTTSSAAYRVIYGKYPAGKYYHAAAREYPTCRQVRASSLSATNVEVAEEEDLNQLTVAELKDRLRSLSLTVGGRKAELIYRLNEYYSSQNSVVGNEADIDAHHVEKYDGNDPPKEEDSSAAQYDEDDSELQQTDNEAEEDLSKLTVPILKERLKALNFPVSGRKADLIERLLHQSTIAAPIEEENEVHEITRGDDDRDLQQVQKDQDVISSDNDADAPTTDNGDEEDSNKIIMDILDDILDDIDDEDDMESNGEMSGTIIGDYDNDQSNNNESASARRARRKKYWKTNEIRELIRANDPRAPAKAEEMISTLERMALEEDTEEYLPDSKQYTLLIEAYAKSGTVEGIQRAEATIDRILEMDEQSNTTTISAQMLNGLMSAYANLGNLKAAEKATELLDRMEYLKEFGDGSVKPTVHSYSIAISAWAKCDSSTAAENAENILDRLFEDYGEELQRSSGGEEEGNGGRSYADELKPNSIVFNSVIDAWARSGSQEAGEKAEALLHRMEVLSRMDEYDVRPDTISFNTCIKAWCNSGRPDAPLKAEELLKKLETNPQYPKRAGGVLTVRPNRLSYNTVLNAWAKSQQPDSALRAESILLRMIKSFKSETYTTITPDSVTFSSVLNALAKSRTVANKAAKCSSLLKAMIELHEDDGSFDTKPNIICYNTVLNCCAFSARGSEEERRAALAIAVETFNQMRQGKYVSPDAVSYGNMLKCCANLMPPGNQRSAMASRLFASCCDEGLVGGIALDEIRRSIPPRAFLPLLADCGYDKPIQQRRKAHSVELKELPREFTKNVKRSDMASRQRGSFATKPKPRRQRQQRRRQKEEGEGTACDPTSRSLIRIWCFWQRHVKKQLNAM